MTFDSAHRSIEGSAPQDLILLQTATEVYRYTTWHSFITWNFDTWSPIPAGRGALNLVPQGEAGDVQLTLKATDPFVVSQILGVPEPNIRMEIIRLEREDGAALSFGVYKITGGTIEGDDCTIRGMSLMDDAWRTEIPCERMQAQCNHILYDQRCAVLATDFDVAATVSSVNDRIIVVNTVGSQPDQWFRLGKIKRNSDGAERTIVDQVGTTLVIAYPFKTLAATNAVTLYAGCDRVAQTCRDKFDNIDNFSGFPPAYVPPAPGEDPPPASAAVVSHRPYNPFTGKTTDHR